MVFYLPTLTSSNLEIQFGQGMSVQDLREKSVYISRVLKLLSEKNPKNPRALIISEFDLDESVVCIAINTLSHQRPCVHQRSEVSIQVPNTSSGRMIEMYDEEVG